MLHTRINWANVEYDAYGVSWKNAIRYIQVLPEITESMLHKDSRWYVLFVI